jgi:hypothetical protein
VRITGHFDDPASATCGLTPGTDPGPNAEDAALERTTGCREELVVTSITPASAP